MSKTWIEENYKSLSLQDITDEVCRILGLTIIPKDKELYWHRKDVLETGWHPKGGYKDILYTRLHSGGKSRTHSLGCGLLTTGLMVEVASRNDMQLSFEGGECTSYVKISGEPGQAFTAGTLTRAVALCLMWKWETLGCQFEDWPLAHNLRPNWCSIVSYGESE